MVTTIQQWRARRRVGETFTLPSGNVVRVRRVHILDLVEQGDIPAPLTGLVSEMLNRRNRPLGQEEMSGFVDLINVVVKASFVDPPIGDDGGEGCLSIHEVDMADRLAVFNWCNPQQEGLRLRRFRGEQAGAVDPA